MEISGIDSIPSVKKLERKDVVQSTRIEDTLSISGEAKKRAEWVEMLKQMPDVREEKIEAAVRSDILSNPSKANAVVANRILNETQNTA